MSLSLKIAGVAALSGLALLFLSSCSKDEPVPEKPVEPVERTVLVYIVANNNLGYADDPSEGIVGGYDNADIEEMIVAARNGALQGNRLIIYHADYMAVPLLKEVTPSGEVVTLSEFEAGVPATSARRMADVIAEVKRVAPAAKYGLILWSHGSGWLENGIVEEPPYGSAAANPKSFGSDGGKRMNVTTLARVLDGEGFDYLWFDCCHMATVEVVYELRHAADVIVGSVSELPSKGMPYDQTLPWLMAGEPDYRSAAQAVFDSYDAYREPEDAWKRTCTMSVISTDALDALAAASRQIFALSDRVVGFDEVQRFTVSGTYYDFGHYMELLAGIDSDGKGSSEALTAAYADVERAMERVVTYRNATEWLWKGYRYEEVKIERHSGLSTYIVNRPGGEFTSNYCNLQWWPDVASVFWSKQ